MPSCCVVDPAGLHHTQPPGGPLGAGGAAGAIYRWLGISNDTRFSEPVIANVKQTCDAKYIEYHRYKHGVANKHVIHAVGPDLRKDPSPEHAHSCLVEAYENIFREFICSEQKLLRLLPVSAGIFAGTFAKDMPKMTMAAMPEAVARLSAEDRKALQKSEMHLCIFFEKELACYADAARALAASVGGHDAKAKGGPGRSYDEKKRADGEGQAGIRDDCHGGEKGEIDRERETERE